MPVWLPMVMLAVEERTALIEPWARAFRTAIADREVGATFKQAAGTMQLDEAQLSRQLAGLETLDPRRLTKLARAYPGFPGAFLSALATEFGGWAQLMGHGFAAVLAPWFLASGGARAVRASLSSRSQELAECDGDSLRRSA